jgi:hypothetical protein
VNDTVSRLHGINSAQMSNKEPRPEPMLVNPFIHDSQLFVTQSSETRNFGGFLFQSHNSFINGGYFSSAKKPGSQLQTVCKGLNLEVSPAI